MNSMETERKESKIAEYFKEIIYGGIDGIVTTFAVVAGFSGAAFSNETTTKVSFVIVLLFGLANLFADAASMGLGNFLSVRSEKDLYFSKRKEESRGVENNPETAKEKTIAILVEKGFSTDDASTLAAIYRTNNEYWVDFLLQHHRELSDPRGEKEVFTGLATFFSFMVFGSIPLLPFMFQSEGYAINAFLYSVAGTFTALVLLGLLKWKAIGTRFLPSLLEVVLVGSVAAVLAFVVGTFFSV